MMSNKNKAEKIEREAIEYCKQFCKAMDELCDLDNRVFHSLPDSLHDAWHAASAMLIEMDAVNNGRLVFRDIETDDYDLDVRRTQVAKCEYGRFEIDFVFDTHGHLSHFEVYFIGNGTESVFIGVSNGLKLAVKAANSYLDQLRNDEKGKD